MSFQQGLSGLNASSKNLDVIGNNVANANTIGAKVARAEFADLYANAMNSASANQVGIGVSVATVAQQFTQGNITITENPLDIAISGNGFFQLSNVRQDANATADAPPTLEGTPVYSRNGQFKVDRNGYIVNNQRQVLLGYVADASGQITPQQARPMQLPTAGIRPQPTSSIRMEFNADSRTPPIVPPAHNVDFNDPLSYHNATSVTVYDEKGQDVALTYYYQKVGADTWNVYATANGDSLRSETRTINGEERRVPAAVATVHFPASGSYPLNAAQDPEGARIVSYMQDPAGVASYDGRIELTVPATERGGRNTLPIPGVTLDLSAATQYGTSFGVTNLVQNGFAAGQFVGISVDDSGVLMARFSNGESKPVGQVELATFRNPQGLMALGGNAWAATFASGGPTVSTPGTGNMGLLRAGSLEEANIDLSAELVNMITAQRNYQANAQTIKTQDQVMQTLVNLR